MTKQELELLQVILEKELEQTVNNELVDILTNIQTKLALVNCVK